MTCSPDNGDCMASTRNRPVPYITKIPLRQYIMFASACTFEDFESTRPERLRLIMRREMNLLQKPLGIYAILYLRLTHVTLLFAI